MTVQKDNKSAKPSICGELTLADKASMYLELIDANKQVNQIHEATKKLQEAIEEFQGTPEEARIMILSADYAVSKKNVQHAIEMLSKVQPEESYFLEAKTKLAQIYLKERLDKRAYLQCYQEMVNTNPGPDSYVLLGDAYMYILGNNLFYLENLYIIFGFCCIFFILMVNIFSFRTRFSFGIVRKSPKNQPKRQLSDFENGFGAGTNTPLRQSSQLL